MTSSDYIAIGALLISVSGWVISYILTCHHTSNSRRESRLDEVEALAFSLTNDLIQHLLLPGNDPGSKGRMHTFQTDATRLRSMLNEIFKRQLPSETKQRLDDLWESATSEPVTDGNRAALLRYAVEIVQIQHLPTSLMHVARLSK